MNHFNQMAVHNTKQSLHWKKTGDSVTVQQKDATR